MSEQVFRIAHDPRPDVRLRFLLSLPVAGEPPVLLACGVEWPGPGDAYCHPIGSWPADATPIAEHPVERCWRSGASIHLVLRRRQLRRSLFVWTTRRNRVEVFWRTQKSITAARPGLRVAPARGLDRPLDIAVDRRERYAWKFPGTQARLQPRELPVGDYGVFLGDRLVAVVERKSPENLAADALSGKLGFALAELERLPSACLVVEGRLSDVLRSTQEHARTDWLLGVLAALQVTHPTVSWIYAGSRALAQAYAYRWLAAALGHARRSAQPGHPSPELPLVTQPRLLEPRQAFAVLDRVGRQREAVRMALDGRSWTSQSYAGHFNISRQTARQDLSELAAGGQLAARGSRRTRHYVAPTDRPD